MRIINSKVTTWSLVIMAYQRESRRLLATNDSRDQIRWCKNKLSSNVYRNPITYD